MNNQISQVSAVTGWGEVVDLVPVIKILRYFLYHLGTSRTLSSQRGSLAIVLFPAYRFKRLRYNLLPFVTDHLVAIPEKLLKTIATRRGAIFSLKFTKNLLAAGLLPTTEN